MAKLPEAFRQVGLLTSEPSGPLPQRDPPDRSPFIHLTNLSDLSNVATFNVAAFYCRRHSIERFRDGKRGILSPTTSSQSLF